MFKMKAEKTVKDSETSLECLIKKIDGSLEFVQRLGKGDYGIVMKVTKNGKYYRLKVNLANEIQGRSDTLEREYKILEDLASKTDVAPKPVKLYEDAPCVWYNRKGKYAYLTEFIEGEVLSKVGKQSEISLTIKLMDLMDRIHDADYKLSKDADLNGENILLDKDGKLYLIDPMFLVPLKEKEEISFGMTTEERTKVNEIIRRYSWTE